MVSIKSLEDFVRSHNEALIRKEKTFQFTIRGVESIERIYSVKPFRIKLNKSEIILPTIRAEAELIEMHGYPYCPCKNVRIIENVCPCVLVMDEIEVTNHCHCLLFVKDTLKP